MVSYSWVIELGSENNLVQVMLRLTIPFIHSFHHSMEKTLHTFRSYPLSNPKMSNRKIPKWEIPK